MNFRRTAWFDVLLALVFGAATTAAFAPYGITWLAVLGPAALLALVARRAGDSPRRALGLAWWWGFGHFATGIYWIYVSTAVYGGAPSWLGVLLCLTLFSYMALYPALAVWVAARAGWFGTAWLVPSFAGLWVAAELLRGWVYSGFPWLSLGYAAIGTPLAKLLPLGGVHLVSLATAAAAAAAATLFDRRVKAPLRYGAAAGVGLAIAVGVLPSPVFVKPLGPVVPLAVVQGNIGMDEKWLPGMEPKILARYAGLTAGIPRDKARLVVWPEVVPNQPWQDVTDFFDPLSVRLAAQDQTLVTGTIYAGPKAGQYLNSLMLIGHETGRYDKSHLVPFGEYFPIPDWLRPIMDVLGTPYGDFSRREALPQPFVVGGLVIAPDICFEDVFGDELRRTSQGAGVLLNATNDAWFRHTSQLTQHLDIARTRAAELGRPMVRATNTGLSALIGPDGRVERFTPLDVPAVLLLHVQGYTGATPYSRYGDIPLRWLAGLMGLIALVCAWRQRGKARGPGLRPGSQEPSPL